MHLLAIETSTEACSVALWIDGDVRERHEVAPRRHTQLALPWAEELLAEAGIARARLDAIAVGRGPGAFTGVRLAIAVGQGIALALDRPLVPVSTLATLAMRADGPHVLAAIDARMGEVYLGVFERAGGHVRAISDEVLGAPGSVPVPEGAWHGVGTGFAAGEGALVQRLRGHPASQLAHVDDAQLPHAADLARLAVVAFEHGGAVAADAVEPAYLRNNVALTLAEQRALRK